MSNVSSVTKNQTQRGALPVAEFRSLLYDNTRHGKDVNGMQNMQHLRKVRSVAPMQTAKTGYIIVSLLLCAVGLFLMFRPDTGSAWIGNVAGILLILFGVIKIIGYCSKDLYRLAFQFDLAFGILLLVLGIVILTKPENLLNFLCVVTGLYVTADSLMKLQTANDARAFGIRTWWVILLTAVLTGAVGVLLMLRPGESVSLMIRILGGVLVAEGALNLITVLMTVKIVQNQKPDIIDVQSEEGD
ncbi:MAG: DUF308 domain-containing protein [Oscillospiraceae bacterium]|nr:DUF308 domain-containing protein [Oscillospiraceae bacterium]